MDSSRHGSICKADLGREWAGEGTAPPRIGAARAWPLDQVAKQEGLQL